MHATTCWQVYSNGKHQQCPDVNSSCRDPQIKLNPNAKGLSVQLKTQLGPKTAS